MLMGHFHVIYIIDYIYYIYDMMTTFSKVIYQFHLQQIDIGAVFETVQTFCVER